MKNQELLFIWIEDQTERPFQSAVDFSLLKSGNFNEINQGFSSPRKTKEFIFLNSIATLFYCQKGSAILILTPK